MIDDWLKITQSLWQPWCLLCEQHQAEAHGVCSGCLADLPWLTAAHCPCCALPAAAGQLCGQCLQNQPAFDATQAVFRYDYPIAALLHAYKYQARLALAHNFASLMAKKLQLQTPVDCIIPMPLHRDRLRMRGFNQAAEIARLLARTLSVPVALQDCERVLATPPQVGLPLRQRSRNLRNAFACKTRLDGCHVLLVDDVMTTGASLHALASCVKKAGAARVSCWVLARTHTN